MSGTFVIAGGTTGIGRELVDRLRVHADRIVVYSREPHDLEVDETVQHHTCDFTAEDVEMPGLPEAISGVAYCPGSINLRSFRSLKLVDFQRDLDVNLLGGIRFLQGCLGGLKKGSGESPSSVVMFSTVAVGQGMPMHASIASAKGAVEGLVRTLAVEWAPEIRVNCIAPALTQTPLASRFFSTDEKKSAMAGMYPLQRTGVPGDLAAMAAFLLSDQSTWITGQVIGVDGGMSTLRS